MKRIKRGFGNFPEGIVVLAIVAIMLIIFIPVIAQAIARANGHRASPAMTFFQAVVLAAGFMALPALLVLPGVCYAKLTRKRTERFREVWLQYGSAAVVVVFLILMMGAFCFMGWELVLRPLLQHFRTG